MRMTPRVKYLKKELAASRKLVATKTKSFNTTMVELQRLLKIEAKHLNLMMTHFGGAEEKMNSYMRTNLVRADFPEIVIDRWHSIV